MKVNYNQVLQIGDQYCFQIADDGSGPLNPYYFLIDPKLLIYKDFQVNVD